MLPLLTGEPARPSHVSSRVPAGRSRSSGVIEYEFVWL